MTQLKNDHCKFCELVVSADKWKVVGYAGLDERDLNSVQVVSGLVEVVNYFIYFGSNISREVDITVELDCSIARKAGQSN